MAWSRAVQHAASQRCGEDDATCQRGVLQLLRVLQPLRVANCGPMWRIAAVARSSLRGPARLGRRDPPAVRVPGARRSRFQAFKFSHVFTLSSFHGAGGTPPRYRCAADSDAGAGAGDPALASRAFTLSSFHVFKLAYLHVFKFSRGGGVQSEFYDSDAGAGAGDPAAQAWAGTRRTTSHRQLPGQTRTICRD